MAETTYFQLTKPGLDEPISPDPYNGNFDIIDKLLNAALEQVAMCRTVIGYDSKNLLKNTAISTMTALYLPVELQQRQQY